MAEIISNKYDFVMLYDVENGNPNGDPDAGNMPRVDPETGHGIVTDVCIKRKIRNYIEQTKNYENGFDIYIRQGRSLNTADTVGLDAAAEVNVKSEKDQSFLDAMCKNYYDIRTFGAVMTSASKSKELSNVAGQVRGPVQITFGRSIDPIICQELTITRCAVTTEKDLDKKSNEMGRKAIVPYGLYRQEGYISASLAQKLTSFNEDDLNLFWNAIINMFEFDRSAARGKMVLRNLIVFKHSSDIGDYPSHKLFDMISVTKKDGVTVPRSYKDYDITIGTNLPAGVTVEDKCN